MTSSTVDKIGNHDPRRNEELPISEIAIPMDQDVKFTTTSKEPSPPRDKLATPPDNDQRKYEVMDPIELKHIVIRGFVIDAKHIPTKEVFDKLMVKVMHMEPQPLDNKTRPLFRLWKVVHKTETLPSDAMDGHCNFGTLRSSVIFYATNHRRER